jgi:hypothetical protein
VNTNYELALYRYISIINFNTDQNDPGFWFVLAEFYIVCLQLEFQFEDLIVVVVVGIGKNLG